jgi:hypothetical protein
MAKEKKKLFAHRKWCQTHEGDRNRIGNGFHVTVNIDAPRELVEMLLKATEKVKA